MLRIIFLAVLCLASTACTNTYYVHTCPDGSKMEIKAELRIALRSIQEVSATDACGGFSVSGTKTDGVQAAEAAIRELAGVAKAGKTAAGVP